MKAPLTQDELNDVRCPACRKLLFKSEKGAVVGALQIKCPRCGTFNHLRPLASPNPERQDREGKDAPCGSLYPSTT